MRKFIDFHYSNVIVTQNIFHHFGFQLKKLKIRIRDDNDNDKHFLIPPFRFFDLDLVSEEEEWEEGQ